MSKMLRSFVLLIMALSLANCTTTQTMQQTEAGIDKSQQKLDAAQARATTRAPAVVSNSGYYVNPNPVSLQQSPSCMNNHITLNAQNVPLSYLVSRITRDCNVVVNYQSDINQNQLVSINYSGPIKGALDQLAADTNYAYDVQGDQVTWEAYVTQTFNIAFMPGTANYQVGAEQNQTSNMLSQSSSSGGTSGPQVTANLGSSEYSNLKGTLSIWDDLSNTLNNLKSSDGKVSVSQATTSVTIYDHPANVQAMAQYINQLNQDLSREVSIQVQVLDVELNNQYNSGINWNSVQQWLGTPVALQGALGNAADVTGLAGTAANLQSSPFASFTIGGTNSNSNAVIQALSQQGQVSVVTQPRVVTMNNQMAEIRITRDTGYLQSVSSTSAVNAGTTSSLNPGVVTDGYTLYLLPKIKDNGVYLQISSDLATLTSLTTVTDAPPGTNPNNNNNNPTQQPFQAIQVPTLAEKIFNQRTLVDSGSTLVIAGFMQANDSTEKSQLFGVQQLGGAGAQHKNVETIIMITPVILGKV